MMGRPPIGYTKKDVEKEREKILAAFGARLANLDVNAIWARRQAQRRKGPISLMFLHHGDGRVECRPVRRLG